MAGSNPLHLVLLVFALVCALIATFWPYPALSPRPHFGWLSFAFFVAAHIL